MDNLVFQVHCHRLWLDYNDHFHWTTDYTIANEVEDAVGLLGYRGTLDGSCSTCSPPDLAYKDTCQPSCELSALLYGVIPSQIQYYAFTLLNSVRFLQRHFCSLLWSLWNSCPVLHCFLQLGIFHKLSQGALSPSLKFEDIEQYRPSMSVHEDATDWFSARLCTAVHTPLGPTVKSNFYSLYYSLKQPISN